MSDDKDENPEISIVKALTRDLQLEPVMQNPFGGGSATTNHGSARWSVFSEIFFNEDVDAKFKPGVTWLGRPVEMEGRGEIIRKAERPIGYNSERSILTIGGAGSGKGVAAVIPTLAVNRGSIICIDPKGENAAVTARHRHEKFGQETYVLDPWGLTANTTAAQFRNCAFNPLGDLVGASDGLIIDRAGQLASAMVIPPPASAGVDPFWNDSAIDLLAALIIHCVTTEPPEKHNLQTIRDYTLFNFDEFLAGTVALNMACNSKAANAVAVFLQLPEKGIGWVRNAVTRNLGWIDDPRMVEVLGLTEDKTRRTFTISDLKKKRLSIYLVLPFQVLEQHPHWLRIFVNMSIEGLREEGRPDEDVLFIMDEFPALGHLEKALNMVTQGRGHGLRLWALAQSLVQIKKIYGEDWENFVSSSGLVHILQANDPFTSEFVSKKIGNTTMINVAYGQNSSKSRSAAKGSNQGSSTSRGGGKSGTSGSSSNQTNSSSSTYAPGDWPHYGKMKLTSTSVSKSNSFGGSSSNTVSKNWSTGWSTGNSFTKTEGTSEGTSTTISEAARPLLAPDEVGRMPKHLSIAFIDPMHPVIVEKCPWYGMTALRGYLDDHPDFPSGAKHLPED